MLPSTTTTPPGNHPSNNRKAAVTEQNPQPLLKCPRCDSSNTKFCYYNNYSLSQPRHFCKTCRRYWTRGGALRNVPIGGGCRKTKKLKTSNVVSSSTSNPVDFGFKFFPTTVAPTSAAGVYTQSSTQFVTSGSGHGFGLDLFGLNGNTSNATGGGDPKISITNIESLSSINQEMHWKLQQQRMALIYHAGHDHANDDENHKEKEEQFQSLEFSGKMQVVGPRDWSFEIQPTNSTITTSAAHFTALQQDQHAVGVSAWTDLHHQFNGSV